MALADWFRSRGVTDAEALTYARSFVDAKIPDDEQELPRFGLTRDDLRAMGAKPGPFQIILDGIGTLERGGETLADDRKDFVKRMFAVAVSVGFAGRLVKMNWISGNALVWPPSANEQMELWRLAVGIFVVVSGWEWYHRDVRDRPLNYPTRFYIDIAVVIMTIIYLFASDKEQVWLFSLVLIFALYVIWDLVSALEFRTAGDALRPRVFLGADHDRDVAGIFLLSFCQPGQQAGRDLLFRGPGRHSAARPGILQSAAGGHALGVANQAVFRSLAGSSLPLRRSAFLALTRSSPSLSHRGSASYPFNLAIATPSRAS